MVTEESSKKVMQLAKEVVPTKKLKFNKNAAIRYSYWFIGLVISIIPLFAIPFADKLMDVQKKSFFQAIFESEEIFFIGVSLAISALNDYIHKTQPKKFSGLWTWLNLIIIILGAMFYGITVFLVQFSETNTDLKINIDYDFLLMYNIFYLLVIIIVGSYKYIKDILEVK